VTVWCAISSEDTVGPNFFENAEEHAVTVNAEWYKVMLETVLQNELSPHQLDLLWFQQDGPSAHTAQISMAVLRTMFPGRLISRFGDINSSTGPPTHLILLYQIISFEATSEAWYMRHVLPILMT
jgi:hypothetical protein